MTSFQIVFSAVCLVQLLLTLMRYRRTRKSVYATFALLWLGGLALLLNPHWSSRLAALMGVGRGVDLIFYLLAFGSIWAHYQHYLTSINFERSLTTLVRAHALATARPKCRAADHSVDAAREGAWELAAIDELSAEVSAAVRPPSESQEQEVSTRP